MVYTASIDSLAAEIPRPYTEGKGRANGRAPSYPQLMSPGP